MDRSSIKDSLARNGFVFTDLDTGVRVTARGPKTPADSENDGERDTVVKAQKNGDVLHRSSHRSRGIAARRYVELVEKHSGG